MYYQSSRVHPRCDSRTHVAIISLWEAYIVSVFFKSSYCIYLITTATVRITHSIRFACQWKCTRKYSDTAVCVCMCYFCGFEQCLFSFFFRCHCLQFQTVNLGYCLCKSERSSAGGCELLGKEESESGFI